MVDLPYCMYQSKLQLTLWQPHCQGKSICHQSSSKISIYIHNMSPNHQYGYWIKYPLAFFLCITFSWWVLYKIPHCTMNHIISSLFILEINRNYHTLKFQGPSRPTAPFYDHFNQDNFSYTHQCESKHIWEPEPKLRQWDQPKEGKSENYYPDK